MQNPRQRGGSPSRRGAADLDRDAKSEAEKLKVALSARPPWSKEVELYRQQCRNLHLTILFSHPLSPYAQSLDSLWHHTTYLLIQAYRDLIAHLSSSAGAAGTTGSMTGSSLRGSPNPTATELKKTITRFRQALSSEETFYKSLISRLVRFYGLAEVGRCAAYLGEAKIPVGDGQSDEGATQGQGQGQEKRDKLSLIYKGLICLGDLERYKEQYREPVTNNRAVKAARRTEEKFAAARRYYEIARGLVPDDGLAFNQLAVISTYLSDNFSTTYFYFRALAIRSAFRNIDDIVYRFLGKNWEKWRSKQKEGNPDVGRDEVEFWKEELVVLVGILYLKAGFTFIPSIQPSVIDRLEELVKSRRLGAEVIVKSTAIIIASHYRARSTAGIEPDPKLVQRSHEAENKASELLLSAFTVLLRIGAEEIEEAQASLGGESALVLDSEGAEDQLPQYISAILRRILPSLRIVSKWIKLDLEYLSRQPSSPTLDTFWETYRRFVNALASVFPIGRLPSLPEPLEEDLDMRGFSPLQRGLTSEGGLSRITSPDSIQIVGTPRHNVHPNEEQLMRLADLQVDARLIIQSQVGGALVNGLSQRVDVGTLTANQDQDVSDVASVSTQTEDDPVNMAMRATLGTGSSVGDIDEAEDEVILWAHSPVPAPNLNSQGSGILHSHSAVDGSDQAANRSKPTAYDLLQNLMLESAATPSAPPQTLQSKSVPVSSSSPGLGAPQSSAPGQNGSGTGSGLLFGTGGGQSGSIWSMTREESAKGQKRASIQDIAAIWNQPQQPSSADENPSAAFARSPAQLQSYGQVPPAQSSPGIILPSTQYGQPQTHLSSHPPQGQAYASPSIAPHPTWGMSSVPLPRTYPTSEAQGQVPYYAMPAYYGKAAQYASWGGGEAGPGQRGEHQHTP
ncbi:hypothetical protein IAR55_006465 [Kwoniella newhampshirensis]|uniref:Protein SMG7 n=1 Tax=Kwoniella newhampshirensis TaxID=1651941 RepID=A0AAW0YIQ7_9TREE